MSSLDTSQFKTVWSDDFTKQGLDGSKFPIKWGDSSEFANVNGLTLHGNGNSAGFLTPDHGAGDSYGYGLFQATVSMPTQNGGGDYGAYVNLWPANNQWPGPEIDLLERWGNQPYSTVHWRGGDGSNQYRTSNINVDVTKPTTIAVDWERDSLTFYVNGQQTAHYSSKDGVGIPKDAADGGTNLALGAGISGGSHGSVSIYNMSYSTHN